MGFGSAEYIHHFVEAKKIAFADRAKYYADMNFNKIPVDYLISKDYANKRRNEIDPNKISGGEGSLNVSGPIASITGPKTSKGPFL